MSPRRSRTSRAAPLRAVAGWLPLLLAPLLLAPTKAWAHAREDGAALAWSFEPWATGFLLLSALLYAVGSVRLGIRRGAAPWPRGAALFWGGWAVLALALVSPIDTLGEHLFASHMLQHELMMLVSAPMLVLARPTGVMLWGLPDLGRRGVAAVTGSRGFHAGWRWLMAPLVAWLLHAVVLWGWHVPALFAAALRNDGVHTLQHASFFVSSLVFWWALLAPRADAFAGLSVLYLFTTAMHNSLLGALLTFSGTAWYAPYNDTAPAFGLSALEDQQLGGLIMWVPAGLVFIAAALWMTLRGLRRAGRTGADDLGADDAADSGAARGRAVRSAHAGTHAPPVASATAAPNSTAR